MSVYSSFSRKRYRVKLISYGQLENNKSKLKKLYNSKSTQKNTYIILIYDMMIIILQLITFIHERRQFFKESIEI